MDATIKSFQWSNRGYSFGEALLHDTIKQMCYREVYFIIDYYFIDLFTNAFEFFSCCCAFSNNSLL